MQTPHRKDSRARISQRAFIAMPFEATHADKLFTRIQLVCAACKLKLRRADSFPTPQPIMADILRELETSGVIIADLTGGNPNVLYEVGYAHACGAEPILIAAAGERLPFDIMATRCIFFNLDTTAGSAAFELALDQAIKGVMSQHQPTVLTTAIERTESILVDLTALAALTDDVLKQQTVWVTGFLSTLAISDQERFEPGEKAYRAALLDERERLLELARRGCTLRFIITPPSEHDLIAMKLSTAILRLQTLLTFFTHTDDPAHESIDWVISPFRQKNAYIIGQRCFSEGFKVGTQRGYPLTVRQTDPDAIHFSIQAHEVLFRELVAYTIHTYPSPLAYPRQRDLLRAAVEEALKKALHLCQRKLVTPKRRLS